MTGAWSWPLMSICSRGYESRNYTSTLPTCLFGVVRSSCAGTVKMLLVNPLKCLLLLNSMQLVLTNFVSILIFICMYFDKVTARCIVVVSSWRIALAGFVYGVCCSSASFSVCVCLVLAVLQHALVCVYLVLAVLQHALVCVHLVLAVLSML